MIIFSQSDRVVAVERIGRNPCGHGTHLLLGGYSFVIRDVHSDFRFTKAEVMIQFSKLPF